MLKFFAILIFFGLISFNAYSNNTNKLTNEGDTIFFYWNKWVSYAGEKKLSGVTYIINDDSLVSTYVYPIGYVKWKIRKVRVHEYYLYTDNGSTALLKLDGNKILMYISFIYMERTYRDSIIVYIHRKKPENYY